MKFLTNSSDPLVQIVTLGIALWVVLFSGYAIWTSRADKKNGSSEIKSDKMTRIRWLLGVVGMVGTTESGRYANPYSRWIGIVCTALILIAIGLGNYVYYYSLGDNKVFDSKKRRQIMELNLGLLVYIAIHLYSLSFENQILKTQLIAGQTISKSR